MTVKTDVNFRITGPCLSLLLRDCECSVSDQMGFLVGEKSSVTTQTISDAEMEEEKIDTTITINGTFPIGLPFVFCSPLSKVNEKTLKDILGSCHKDVVGWYTFRRNSCQGATLREALLHRELSKVLPHMPPQYFVFCIVTTTTNDRNATYIHKFAFSTANHRRFQPVSVVETNLGEPEDNVYRNSATISNSFTHLQEALHSLKTRGVINSKEAMNTLHTELNKHIEVLESSVSRLQAEADERFSNVGSKYSCTEEKTSLGDESSASTSSKVKSSELSSEY